LYIRRQLWQLQQHPVGISILENSLACIAQVEAKFKSKAKAKAKAKAMANRQSKSLLPVEIFGQVYVQELFVQFVIYISHLPQLVCL